MDSDLPVTARDRINCLVAATRLRGKEKVDVAKTLIAEFEKGLADGVSEDDLLAQYAKPRRAAKAIRRKMIRQRSRAWWIWHRTWITVCLLIAATYIGLGLYYASNKSSIKVDYLAKLNERAAAVPEADRAWPVYREVLIELDWDSAWPQRNEDPIYRIPDYDSPNWDKMVLILNEHQEQILRLRAAAQRPGLGFVLRDRFEPADLELFAPTSNPLSTDWPLGRVDQNLFSHLSVLIRIGRLLDANAVAAARRDDPNECAADLLAIMRMARFANEHGLSFGWTFRVSLLSIATDSLSRVLAEQPDLFTDVHLATLMRQLANEINIELDISGELLLFDDMLQRLFTDTGHGDGHFDVHLIRGGFKSIFGDNSEEPNWYEKVIWYALSPINVTDMPSRNEMHVFYYGLAKRFQNASSLPMRELPVSGVEEAWLDFWDAQNRMNRMM